MIDTFLDNLLDIPKQLTSRLSSEQLQALYPFVQGRYVHDFGAGDGNMACELITSMGAHHVIAIDRHRIPDPPVVGIECHEMHFDQYRGEVDIAFCSWPVNWPCALEPHIKGARLVVYLGKCTDGSMCGYQGFWEHLVTREVLLHKPARQNVLLVYGPEAIERPLVPEEFAAIKAVEGSDRIYTYEELYESRFARLDWWPDEI